MLDDRWMERWKGLMKQQAPSPAILELGCGEGRDTRWLVEQGFRDLVASDLSREALARCALAAPSARLLCHDLSRPLPFGDARFDIIVASLCLHYFPWDDTVAIVQEIRRCLAPGGLLLCRVNSTRDVHYGAVGHPVIAPHFFDVAGRPKRFFDAEDVARLFADGWEQVSMREMTIFRYENPKKVWEVVLRKQ